MQTSELRVKKPDGTWSRGWRLDDDRVCVEQFRPEVGETVFVDGEERRVVAVGEETSLPRRVVDEEGAPVARMDGSVSCYPTTLE